MKLMLATLIEEPFNKEGWLFEIKWDGYRARAYKNKEVKLISRGNQAYNARFPEIVQALAKLPGRFILDGEIVILGKKGRSQFQLLQRNEGTAHYYLFDILSFEGKDLTRLPLIDRKKILKKLLSAVRSSRLRFNSHVETQGKAFFARAKKKGYEGVVAKKADSTYQFRRSKDWLKIKSGRRQEAVIGGFTEPKGGRTRFGALLVGVYKKGKKLVYAGHVGGGFDRKRLEDVYAQLRKIITPVCPFAQKPRTHTPATWVKPKLICEVAFAEWTDDGIMRMPIFKGMRSDKKPREVIREKAKYVTYKKNRRTR